MAKYKMGLYAYQEFKVEADSLQEAIEIVESKGIDMKKATWATDGYYIKNSNGEWEIIKE